MKSIKNETKPPQTKSEYPCLKIRKPKICEPSIIVLFTGRLTGVVMWKNDVSIHQVGHYSNLWDESSFESYHGSITLYSDDPTEV